jgi:TonB-linked SusC/RagA family outer membrane protein
MRKLLLAVSAVLLFTGQALAQKTITGKVTDDKGSPIPNASVVVKGSATGTVTKIDGTYVISVPPEAKALVFSSVDMAPTEVTIGSQSTINTSLKAADRTMTEVVVVGYQTRRKKDEAGAISSIRGTEIENKPNVSLDKALQGRAAGVLVQSNNGIPGGSINVRIRGVGSFLAGTQPLYVVDGVQMNTRNDASFSQTNPLSFLNPNDIESVDVLKDAATAAIYGSQASNGVIIITTKKGKAGKTRFNFNTYFGQSSPIKKFDVLNSQEYSQLRVEAYQSANPTASTLAVKNAVLGEFRLPAQANDKAADSIFAQLITYDWQDAVMKNGAIQNYELSLSGGNDRTTFRVSGSYTKQEAIISKADFKRGTMKLDLSTKATDRLTVSTSMNLSTANQQIPFATDGSFLGSPAFAGSGMLPVNAIYNADGTYFGIPPANLPGVLNQNIVAVNDYNSGYQRTNQIVGNLAFDYKFTNWLVFRSFYGLDYRLVQGKSYRDPRTPDAYTRRGLGQVQSNWNTNFITTQTLNFNQNFGDKHKVDGILGFEYKKEDNEGISASADNFPSYQFVTINAAANPLSTGEFFSGFRRIGGFGSVNYNYGGRYIISGTLRYDGSSRFGEDNKFGWFPSVKAAWNVDEESFMKNSNIFSQLRVRLSWGQTGNDQIGNFDSRGLFGSGAVYNAAAGINYTQLANPALKWERNETVNFGLDLGFFNNRINTSIELYQKKTKDLLLSENVSWLSGFGAITSNVGSMENKGIEVTLGGDVLRPRSSEGLRWNTNFVFSYNKNKVVSLYKGIQELPGDPATRVGRTIGSIFTQRYAGVNPATGRPMWYDTLGNLTYQVQARDRVYIGDNQPEFYGGWSNTFSYKGLSLEVFFNYEYGRLVQDGQVLFLAENIARLNALQEIYDHRWTTPGQVTTYPRMNVNGAENKGSGAQTGDRTWFKADYIRLKTVTLSYDLPSSVYNKLHLSNARFYVQGTNLWTYADADSYDIEFFGASTGIIPNAKLWTAGIQIGF